MPVSLDWINAIVTLGGLLIAVGIFIQQSRNLTNAITSLTRTVECMRREFGEKIDGVKNEAALSRERVARLEERLLAYRQGVENGRKEE